MSTDLGVSRPSSSDLGKQTGAISLSWLQRLWYKLTSANSNVIDIWSLQPQPHLQPQATLHGPVSASTSKSGATDDVPVRITTSPPSERSPSADKSLTKPGAVPKHWGEVVINPRKGKQAGSGSTDEANARDVFGVLKVT